MKMSVLVKLNAKNKPAKLLHKIALQVAKKQKGELAKENLSDGRDLLSIHRGVAYLTNIILRVSE
jgi:hypothetical protein